MTDLPTKEEMSSLAVLVAEWEQNESAIGIATEQMKALASHKLKLETNLIPSLMASAGGIDKFTLDNGTAITIKDELFASITQAKQQEAFAWLEEHGHGDVIKNEMKIALGKGDDANERFSSIIAVAESLGITDYSAKRSVHPGTLAALIREQLGEGVELPKETFGVHQQRRAVIKVAK